MEILNYLQEFNAVSIFVRLLMALVCGGLLGIERSKKHQAAGVRTFSLVCLGSTLIILTNEFICIKCGGGDTSRMAAQVISGIGYYTICGFGMTETGISSMERSKSFSSLKSLL